MTKNEYANEVAKKAGGEVREIEKANGVILTGIMIDNGTIARPTVYIDQMFTDGLTTDEAAEKVRKVAEKRVEVDADMITNYEAIKPMLRARLYNKATSAEVKKAAGHGFDDLIIVPYIEDVLRGPVNGSIKVTKALLEQWGKTAAQVIRDAEKNSKAEAELVSMADALGIPAEMAPPMMVVSSARRNFGAYAVLAKMATLKKMFPEGFTVLPSSVHEVIVVPMDDQNTFDNMVNEVNASEVDVTEQLSNHAYRIAA